MLYRATPELRSAGMTWREAYECDSDQGQWVEWSLIAHMETWSDVHDVHAPARVECRVPLI